MMMIKLFEISGCRKTTKGKHLTQKPERSVYASTFLRSQFNTFEGPSYGLLIAIDQPIHLITKSIINQLNPPHSC